MKASLGSTEGLVSLSLSRACDRPMCSLCITYAIATEDDLDLPALLHVFQPKGRQCYYHALQGWIQDFYDKMDPRLSELQLCEHGLSELVIM